MQMSVEKSRKNSPEKKVILMNGVEQKLLRRRIGILDKMQ